MQALAVTTYATMDLTFLAVGSFLFVRRWKGLIRLRKCAKPQFLLSHWHRPPGRCQRQQPTDLVQGSGVQQLRTRRTRPRTDLDS